LPLIGHPVVKYHDTDVGFLCPLLLLVCLEEDKGPDHDVFAASGVGRRGRVPRAATAASRRRWYDGQTNPASHRATDRIETRKAKPQPQVEAGAGGMVIQNLLKRITGHKPDIIVIEGLPKSDLSAPAKRVLMRCDKDQVIEGGRFLPGTQPFLVPKT
jgi:hypothetical protein